MLTGQSARGGNMTTTRRPTSPLVHDTPMRTIVCSVRLSSLIAVLALAVASAGLFWPAEGRPSYPFTTLHSQTVQM